MKKLKNLSMLLIIVFGMVFTGCTKENSPINSEIINIDADGIEDPATKSSGGYYYGVSESILNHFVHYCQRKAGPYQGYPYYGEGYLSLDVAKKACCPTSYMMAAACLAHYKDGGSTQYNANGSKLAGIINYYHPSTSYRYLNTMRSYCNSQDGSFLTSDKELYCSSRYDIKKFIENSLANNRFVLMNVNAKIYSYSKVNNNLLYQNSSNNPDVSFGNSLYISQDDEVPNSIGAHVILIIRIDKNSDGNGIVQYIDPLAITRSSSNRKYVLYSKLLDSNLISGINSRYDAISVGLK